MGWEDFELKPFEQFLTHFNKYNDQHRGSTLFPRRYLNCAFTGSSKQAQWKAILAPSLRVCLNDNQTKQSEHASFAARIFDFCYPGRRLKKRTGEFNPIYWTCFIQGVPELNVHFLHVNSLRKIESKILIPKIFQMHI